MVRGRTWLLRRTLTSGDAQVRFGYGKVGDVPVAGSWTGGRRTGIGVERDGQWLLRNRRSAGPATPFWATACRPTGPSWATGTATARAPRPSSGAASSWLRARSTRRPATRTLTFRG